MSTNNFSGNEFSMNSNSTDLNEQKRVLVSEMDFFSTDKIRERVFDNNPKEDSDNGVRFTSHVNTGLNLLTANTGSDQSTIDDDGISSKADDKQRKSEMEDLQVQLDQMNTENLRLKGLLNQVTHDYNKLKMHLIMQQQQQQNHRVGSSHDQEELNKNGVLNGSGGSRVPRKFMDLGLATVDAHETCETSNSSSEGGRHSHSGSPHNNAEVETKIGKNKEIVMFEQEKSGFQNREAESSNHESNCWSPNKVPKLNESKDTEQPVEATMRKARVSVRARSEASMISDGCQWRKYGQKMAKGNPCPRAYYRCTMAVGCPVRKQIQRCAEDKTILVTTYEGTHNHPLPPAAMEMASVTSSAASMLLSGSMTSVDGLMNNNFLTSTLLPCSSSIATISASAPFPTVTLDLTQPPNPLQFQRPPTQFHLPFINHPQMAAGSPQRFTQSLYNQSKFSGVQMSTQNVDQSQLINHQPPPPHQAQYPHSLVDMSAATAAIEANPMLTAALVAAISSYMGNGGGSQTMNNDNNTIPSTDDNKKSSSSKFLNNRL